MLLGCIGDDFTGSSDLGNTLAKQGMRVVQYTGVPQGPADPATEAGVVALKTRSVPVAEATAQSLKALAWLQDQGCTQFLFKYCSTFDSTKDGNIGPVADALADALGATRVIVCPAFPGTGRSIYQGHLFVNDVLLNESGMQNHPLTPMTDPDLRRWLGYQTVGAVGHVNTEAVFAGPEAIRKALDAQHVAGHRLIVVDALKDEDLISIGVAAADLPLLTGGSGIAIGLPANFAAKGLLSPEPNVWQGTGGKCVALSGSCSVATRAQVAAHKVEHPTFEVDAVAVIEGQLKPEEVVGFLMTSDGVPLAYSSADPDVVKAVQADFGRERAAESVEHFFQSVAQQLVAAGVGGIISAGGETSGAVVLGTRATELAIGPEIDPGVPALRAGPELVLTLKSGNFGAPDFFAKAAAVLTSNP
ncbi:MAG: four-carbon acid sugar kinase family protein [Silicimonas sp.]|nr:four-carbon acid sugar kinase family protein [Silicimonas sp.]